MPVRHFYLLPHYSCNGLFFLFSVCWLHVNEFNSLWEELRGRSQKTTATQKVCLFGIFTCSHITVAMVYSFYFLCVGSRRNEFNSLGRDKGNRSEGRGLFWYCLCDAVNDDKMISQLSLYMVNLSLYIKVTTLFFVKWQSSFSLLLVKSEKIIFGRYIFRASSSLLISPLVSTKAYCIHSFWSQQAENKNNRPLQL